MQSLKLQLSKYLMKLERESISYRNSAFQVQQQDTNHDFADRPSQKWHNLRIDSLANDPKPLNPTIFNGAKLLNQSKCLTILKLVWSKVNQRLLLKSLSKIRQNHLVNRCNNNFSAIALCSNLKLEAQNPECEYLGLQSRCKDKNQEKQSSSNPKNLHKQIFRLKLQNQRLNKLVVDLKQEIEENLKRQAKEVMKKRQSLEGLMEEISDKNQLIQELNATIRLLQTRLGAKDKGVLQCLLQEDSQSLRRTITRLESVNDKLNFDLEKIKKEKHFFQIQNKQIKQKCEEMQSQFKLLKQHFFDLEANIQILQIMKKEVNLAQKRYRSKVQRTKKLQKRLSQVIKSKDNILELQTEVDLQTFSKKVDTQSTASNLRRTSSIKSQFSQNKLQTIFNFIFNISQENYQLQFEHLFDDQQRQLMRIHKQIFINNKKNHIIPTQKLDMLENSYYFGKTFHQVFNHTSVEKQSESRDKNIITNLQTQCQKLISKICSLKERQMHIRQVVMNLLKAFELKPLKKQSEIMLNVVCQIFEYSQGERQLFSHPKTRRLFGFI